MTMSTRRLVLAFAAVPLAAGLLFLYSTAVRFTSPPGPAQTLSAIDDVVARQTVDGNSWLSVRRGQPATWILSNGFLTPDAQGSWLAETTGSLRLRVVDGSPVSIELVVTPFLGRDSPTRRLRLSSTVDAIDRELAGGEESILIALNGDPAQDVWLDCSSTDSPQAFEINPDQRRFCLKLLAVRVNVE
jgi:hypothetical protein